MMNKPAALPADPVFSFPLNTLNRRIFNTSTLRHRHFDGQMVSTHQSGSHWLKYMLSNVLALTYDLPMPRHIQDDDLIGHPKAPPKYSGIPRIVHSHSMPHALISSGLAGRLFKLPKYLVLLRDPRYSLISHYERYRKGGKLENIDFTTYLHGDPRHNRFHNDLWTRICFMNGWGDVLQNHCGPTLSMTYEAMERDTGGCLRRACAFFFPETPIADDTIERVLALSTREEMAKRPNPEVKTVVVRTEKKPIEDYFTEENEAFLRHACRRFLRHDFGYDLR
jgi:hypothetical protein